YTGDDLLATLTAKNDITGDQVTEWIYGTTLDDSEMASTLLVKAKIYPDTATDRVESSYNRQSQVIQQKDQRETVHVYDYDNLGRRMHDRVTELGDGVDGAIRRITYTYDVRGLVTSVSSVDDSSPSAGAIVNQVQAVYDSFEQVITEYQSHSG